MWDLRSDPRLEKKDMTGKTKKPEKKCVSSFKVFYQC